MGDLVGYARVSTGEQKLDLQLDALEGYGLQAVVVRHGVRVPLKERPELAKAIDYLRSGDTLVVWRLDRLGRSVRHLIDLVGELEKRGIGLRSLQEEDRHDNRGRAPCLPRLLGARPVREGNNH